VISEWTLSGERSPGSVRVLVHMWSFRELKPLTEYLGKVGNLKEVLGLLYQTSDQDRPHENEMHMRAMTRLNWKTLILFSMKDSSTSSASQVFQSFTKLWKKQQVTVKPTQAL